MNDVFYLSNCVGGVAEIFEELRLYAELKRQSPRFSGSNGRGLHSWVFFQWKIVHIISASNTADHTKGKVQWSNTDCESIFRGQKGRPTGTADGVGVVPVENYPIPG